MPLRYTTKLSDKIICGIPYMLLHYTALPLIFIYYKGMMCQHGKQHQKGQNPMKTRNSLPKQRALGMQDSGLVGQLCDTVVLKVTERLERPLLAESPAARLDVPKDAGAYAHFNANLRDERRNINIPVTWLTGLLAQKFFPGLYAAKDRDETQALTRGLSKEKAREKIASQPP
jgi:hypothetical protein